MGFSIRLPRREGKGGAPCISLSLTGDPIFIFIIQKCGLIQKREAPHTQRKTPLNGLFKLDAKACTLLKAQIG